MAAFGVQTRNKLFVLCSLLIEVAGFADILQGQALDGMLLVLFGMTFCMMIVFAGSFSRPITPDTLPPDHAIVRNELLDSLFRPRPAYRNRQRPNRP